MVPTHSDPHHSLARRGLMFILSSPSGAGKTTISRMMLMADEAIRLSVSVTTRPPRPGEIDGVDYHFVDDARFDAMVASDDFYEWAHVFDYRYGTPKGYIRQRLKEGQDFLFDIDWQGTQQLYQKDQQDGRQRLHPAPQPGSASSSPGKPRYRQRRHHRRPHWTARAAKSAIGRNMIMSW